MAATRTRGRPSIRLRAAPPLDPPYDDELTLVAWLRGTGDQLELDLHGGNRPHPSASRAGSTDAAGTGHSWAPEAGGGPGPAGTTPERPVAALATAEAQRAARRFLDAALEMVNGYRPVAHARALTTPGLAAGLVEQLHEAAGRLPRPGRPGQPATQRVRLLSLRVCEPAPGVAEAAAAIGNDERTWALAFRLERQGGRWIAVLVRML